MPIALIADIHGNLPALQAVLDDIHRRGIQSIYCLGDMVGKGPSSAQVLDSVRDRCEKVVYGNWDRLVTRSDNHGGPWYRAQLGEEKLKYLTQLPEALLFTLGGKSIKLYHGRFSVPGLVMPDSPRDVVEQALNACGENGAHIVGIADMHHPYLFTMDGRTLFNTGSVGNATDGLAEASYAILHEMPRGISIELVRLSYDNEKAVDMAMAIDDLPMRDAYIYEVRTGYYGRGSGQKLR